MFKEKYARLEEYKNDLSDLESGIREYKERLEERNLKANKYAVQETFKEIIGLAMKVSGLSDFKYNVVIGRIERAKYCLSPEILLECLKYVSVLIRKTEDYLDLQMAEFYLCPKQETSQTSVA